MEFPAPAAPFVVALLVGTVKKPKITNITTGMFTGCSMVFHTQEGEKYHEHNGEMKPAGLHHEYVRNNVNKTSVNLRCSFRDAPRRCKATLTLEDFLRRELSLYNMLPEERQLEQVIDLCYKIGRLNEHNVIGQFEKRIAADIANLDEEDELHLDDELN